MLREASKCVQVARLLFFPQPAVGLDGQARVFQSTPCPAQLCLQNMGTQSRAVLCGGASCALEAEQHPWPTPTGARGTSSIVTTKMVSRW